MSYSSDINQNASQNKNAFNNTQRNQKLMGLFDYKRTLTMIQVLKYYSILHFYFYKN